MRALVDLFDRDNDYKLDLTELNLAYRVRESQEMVSKMVCKHKNEWSYKPVEIKEEVATFFDSQIDDYQKLYKEDFDIKELDQEKSEKLQGLEIQVKDLMFWEEAKKASYDAPKTKEAKKREEAEKEVPRGMSTLIYENPQTQTLKAYYLCDEEDMLRDKNGNVDLTAPLKSEVLAQEKERKKQKELIIPRKFPSTDMVYHFHPIAFVNHMKLIFGGGATGECYCNKDLPVELIREIVKRVSGRDTLWNGMKVKGVHHPCNIDDKTFESFTKELNDAFKRHGLTKCIQKISFLAQAASETNFQQNYEMPSKYASSRWTYKGRGIIQLTGDGDDPGIYVTYANAKHVNNPNIITNPDLISNSLYYTIDSSVWYFKIKKVPKWSNSWSGKNAKYDYLRKQRVSRFSEVLGKNLIELSNFNHKSINYFWLQCKMIHGYLQKDTFKDHPNGWEKRHKSLNQIKSVFGFSDCINNDEKNKTKDRAPWMKIAISEAQIAAGCKEEKEPMLAMGYKYLKFAGSNSSPADDSLGQWCASYLSWCIDKSGYGVHPVKWKRSNSQEFRFIANEGKVYKKIEEPIFGALAVYTKYSDDNHGHIGFVYGKTTDGKILLLGGNQKDTIKCDSFGEKTRTKFLNGYYIPIDYTVNENDKLTDKDVYKNSSDANFKLGIYVSEKDKTSANKTS